MQDWPRLTLSLDPPPYGTGLMLMPLVFVTVKSGVASSPLTGSAACPGFLLRRGGVCGRLAVRVR